MLGNSRSPPPPTSLSRLRMPTDWLDRGTRCARRIFVRLAGMVHTRFRKSNSDRSANRNPPGRGKSRANSFSAKRVLGRSEEHPSELKSLLRSSYAVFCFTKKTGFAVYEEVAEEIHDPKSTQQSSHATGSYYQMRGGRVDPK